MPYTLIGSVRSPYVRSCRMLLIQNRIEFDFKVLDFVDDAKAAAELAHETPINRVPILVDGEQKIFDSRVIAGYILKKHQLTPFSLEEENLLSAVYSCLDTGVALFLLRKDGFDVQGPGFYFTRQRARIPECLKYVTPFVKDLDPSRRGAWNFVSMALFSFLYWGEARELLTLSDYPDLAAFMVRFKTMPGVAETGF